MAGIGRNSLGVYLANIVVLGAGYLPSYFFAHSIGLTDQGRAVLGTYQLFLLLASTVNTVADLRLHYGYVYFSSRGGDFRQLTSTYFVLRVLLVLAGGIIFWILAPGFGILSYLGLLGIWLMLPVLWSVSLAYSQILTIKGRAAVGQVPQIVEIGIRSVGLLVVALTNYHHPNLSAIVWEATLAFFLGALASTLFSLPTVLRASDGFSGALGLKMFRWELPMAGSFLLIQFSGYVSQYIVVGAFGTAVFNVFSAANGFRAVLMILPTAITVPLFPRLTQMHNEVEWEEHRRYTWLAVRYTLFLMIPTAIGFAVLAPFILGTLYSTPYVTGGTVALQLLALSAIPASVSLVYGIGLDSIGLRRRELYATAVQVSLVLPTTILLIKPYGILRLPGPEAAGIGVLASCIGGLLVTLLYTKRYLGLTLPWKLLGGLGVISGLAWFVVSSGSVHHGAPVSLLLYGTCILIVFLVAYVLFFLNPDDLRRITSAFPVPRAVRPAIAWITQRLYAKEQPLVKAGHLYRPVGANGIPEGGVT